MRFFKDCCPGKATEARSCNDEPCKDFSGVYGEGNDYLMIGSGKTLDDYLGKIVPGPPVPPEGTLSNYSLNQTREILTCNFTFMLLSLQANFIKKKPEGSNHNSLSLSRTRAYIFITNRDL